MFGPPLFYYSSLFMAASGYIAMLVSYKNRSKFSELAFFHWYPFASFVQTSILVYLLRTHVEALIASQIADYSSYAFLLLEAFICLQFFVRLNQHKYTANRVLLLFVIYFTTTLLILFFSPRSFSILIIYSVQAIVMISPGFVYLMELFKDSNIKNLMNRPYFWIAIGFVFYSASTLPLFLILYSLLDKEGYLEELNLLAINAICYGILFLLITRLFMYKPEKLNTINY